MNQPNRILIETGVWDELEVTWELYATTEQPPLELCTAVMCIAIADDKIVLARSKRGWGMLGGHIEDGESIEMALLREAQEEGGFTINHYELFAVREIASKRPMPHQQPGKVYPFPTSYMTYYWATTKEPVVSYTGQEILESTSFAIDTIGDLNTPDQRVIEAGWRAYRDSH